MRKKHFQGGNSEEPMTFFKWLKMIADWIRTNAAYLFNMTQYIDCNQAINEKNMTYFVSIATLIIILYILPVIVFSLSLTYLIQSFSIKKAKFYKDRTIYNEVFNLNQIGDVFISDYIISMIVIIAVYITSIIYILYNPRICYNLLSEKLNIIYLFLLLCVASVIVHIVLFISFINKVGGVKEELVKLLVANYDQDYINFLDAKAGTSHNIIQANNIDNLSTYISSVINEVKKESPNVDMNKAKTSTDANVSNAYNKIKSSMITYAVIYKMQVNQYDQHYNITVDKDFLSSYKNVLLSINADTNVLLDIDFTKINGMNNDDSDLMSDVTADCEAIKIALNNAVNNLKNKLWDVSLPPKIAFGVFILVICLLFIYMMLSGGSGGSGTKE
jgi:hypothetical protein